ncbi:hypothetical protein GUITHDRAFT_107204 [Guillardia theta CCMP2712]|uniref:Uncharacterized protein n=1 Tax=Guillardia theta (strain CCMP2712) TaxID=905079 RepID=L1JFE3_GUITC|nr:hypothetical protein GUITHDRAFT_107204 [Guillardia theta CCMP2712]EKX46849.1 hypothetical protein GUITHDRAFT_107204 [Guillardia theta CCMP2712]|eukprot:XP_005833829.1 hypothetical protein GUITHDRAFT_107204 [Guillardia theta CCMP2712]
MAARRRPGDNKSAGILTLLYDEAIKQSIKLEKDTNKQIEDKDQQIDDLKNEKISLEANKDQLINALNLQLQDMRLKAFIVNNRALIEIGISRYNCSMSLTDGIKTFLTGHLLTEPKNTLNEYSKTVCRQLRDFGFAGKEQSVSKELANLMHEISKPLHSMQVCRELSTEGMWWEGIRRMQKRLLSWS